MAHETDHYVYRRRLPARELLPALGVALGVGAFAFYVARVLLQRTPLPEYPGASRPVRPPGPAAAQRRDGLV